MGNLDFLLKKFYNINYWSMGLISKTQGIKQSTSFRIKTKNEHFGDSKPCLNLFLFPHQAWWCTSFTFPSWWSPTGHYSVVRLVGQIRTKSKLILRFEGFPDFFRTNENLSESDTFTFVLNHLTSNEIPVEQMDK